MRVTVKVERIDAFSGASTTCDGELSIDQDANGTVQVKLTKGGETGFESFTFPANRPFGLEGWCACIGRPHEYDTIIVSKDEMERAYRLANVLR